MVTPCGFRPEREHRVLEYGFRNGGPLAREFGLPDDIDRVGILIRSRTAGSPRRWTLELGPTP
jgi:hypothetical protein